MKLPLLQSLVGLCLVFSMPRMTSADIDCLVQVPATSGAGGPGTLVCVPIVPLGMVPPDTALVTGCDTHYLLISRDDAFYGPRFLEMPPCDSGPCGGMSSAGSATLECQLTHGVGCPGYFLDVRTVPGVRTSVARDAFQARFESDTDRRTDICYEQYSGNGSRMLVLPTIDPSPHGRKVARITGFAAFFLVAPLVNDELRGEFLYWVIPGGGRPTTR